MNRYDYGSYLFVAILFFSLLSLGSLGLAADVLELNSTEFFYGWSNITGDQIHDNDTATSYNMNYLYDNSTLSTRSLTDFGSDINNYATLYVVGYEFVYGWSATIYDIYRNQSYECIGEAGYQDWLYQGLYPIGDIPTSFPQTEIPWYVPIIGYIAGILLPFMIISYYWNKARDFKSGLMVLFVCIMCFILFEVLWNLSDALMTYIYQ